MIYLQMSFTCASFKTFKVLTQQLLYGEVYFWFGKQ